MRRVLTLFATLVLLWTLFAQLNHALSAWRVYVFGGALFVAFAALTQPPRAGLIATLLAGLTCDANAPVPLGTHTLLFAAAHLALFHVRERVPRGDNLAAITVVLLTNLALFLVFSFLQIHNSPAPAAMWPRLIADLVCSQIFLVVITPWFFALQSRALVLARVEREAFAHGQF
jgi:rod shape-determining protein MreD